MQMDITGMNFISLTSIGRSSVFSRYRSCEFTYSKCLNIRLRRIGESVNLIGIIRN